MAVLTANYDASWVHEKNREYTDIYIDTFKIVVINKNSESLNKMIFTFLRRVKSFY